jgi:hypothetical protein
MYLFSGFCFCFQLNLTILLLTDKLQEKSLDGTTPRAVTIPKKQLFGKINSKVNKISGKLGWRFPLEATSLLNRIHSCSSNWFSDNRNPIFAANSMKPFKS